MRTGSRPGGDHRRVRPLTALIAAALSLWVVSARAQVDAVFEDPAPCEPDHFVATTSFGRAIATLGSNLLIGAAGGGCEATTPNHGIVYLVDGTTGAVIRNFRSPLSGIGDFGVAIAMIGSDVVVGSPWTAGAGAVYEFDSATAAYKNAFFRSPGSTNDGYGSSLARIPGGLFVGAPRDDVTGTDSGAVYLFSVATGQVTHIFTNPAPGTKSFGTTIAALGTNVLIGAPAAGTGGKVYLFDSVTGVLRRTFSNPGPQTGGFGRAVAAVGTRVLIGAPSDNPGDTGVAYLFDSASGAILHTFADPRPDPDDGFGTAVAAIGTDAIIGSPGPDADREGAVFRFDADPASPTFGALRQTFMKSQLVTKPKQDDFGSVLAVDGGNVLIGAPGYPSFPTVAPGTVYRYDTCGNGLLGVAEQCDDGNGVAGDGCNSCALELCPPAPVTGCRRAPEGSSTIVMQQPAPPLHVDDKLVFRWKGPATTGPDFGSPRTTTAYELCLYDNSLLTQPLIHAAAPAGGSCIGHPCWQQSGQVIFKYKDRLRGPDGLLSILLRPGPDGAAFLRFRGRGPALRLPDFPLAGGVTVQIRNNETGVCWESVYGADIRANSSTLFRASSD